MQMHSDHLARSLDVMSILVSILLFYTVVDHSVMVSARGCPGSTCISPVWLERCKLSLSRSLGLSSGGPCQAAAWLPAWWHAQVC